MSRVQTVRRPRKDAQHNRAHILDVAGRAFASEGVDVSMDAIGRLAEVGAGTLYRHFPNKDALLAALLEAHYEGLARTEARIEAGGHDSANALDLWIDALGDWMLVYEGLPEPIRAACTCSDSLLAPSCHRVIEATGRFLRAAQQDGHARSSLTGRDIFLGALAIAWASGAPFADQGTRATLSGIFKSGWLIPSKS